MASADPPTKLDPIHDAETIALLEGIREAKIGDVSARVDDLEAHLAARINGDLRPRILAYINTQDEQERRLQEVERKAGIRK